MRGTAWMRGANVQRGARIRRRLIRGGGVATAVSFTVAAVSAAGAGPRTITQCTEEAVKQATSAGGSVVFGQDCDIPFTSTLVLKKINLDLEANGHSVTFEGGGAVRIMSIEGGQVTLGGVTFRNGAAQGSPGARGSGSAAGKSGGVAEGGALMVAKGSTAVLNDDEFIGNTAEGGAGAKEPQGPPTAATGALEAPGRKDQRAALVAPEVRARQARLAVRVAQHMAVRSTTPAASRSTAALCHRARRRVAAAATAAKDDPAVSEDAVALAALAKAVPRLLAKAQTEAPARSPPRAATAARGPTVAMAARAAPAAQAMAGLSTARAR